MGTKSTRIALTGGPGGGKSTLIEELLRDPTWYGCVAVLPEAISLKCGMGISPGAQRRQWMMMHLPMVLENCLARGIVQDHRRVSLCHRGSLDPLAWDVHPRCYRLDNEGRDRAAKSREARAILDGRLHKPGGMEMMLPAHRGVRDSTRGNPTARTCAAVTSGMSKGGHRWDSLDRRT